MARLTVPDLFVEQLAVNGVKDLFYNPGYDVVPLLAAAARYHTAGRPAPRPVMCLNESTALHAAHGHYLVSGRPQVLLIHAELGTQQIGGAIQQAWYGKVPVVICAADMVTPGRQNWRGEPYDQAAMLRNCLKWDHRVASGESFQSALNRAFEIALSAPCGPVYLTYPVDILSTAEEVREILPARPAPLPAPDNDSLARTADILVKAENPLIMTGYSGRQAASVPALVELAEILGCRVVTSGTRLNFPSDHPLCANLEPSDGMQSKPYYLSADALLVIDYDIPYAHPADRPGRETRLIHVDVDFVKQGQRLWDRTPDIAIQADSAAVIGSLITLLRQKLGTAGQTAAQQRAAAVAAEHQHQRAEWAALGRDSGKGERVQADWLASCLNQVIGPEDIIVNQTITPSAAISRQIPRNRPGTLLGCAGGTIGWALGAALGAKIAAPDRLVAGLMGDGAFVYGGPIAALWPAVYYQAPFLTVIFNNQAYGAIRSLFQGEQKDGIENSLITPSPAYALVAESCGGWGRTVEKPAEVLPALQAAVERVRAGQPAVVDVRLE